MVVERVGRDCGKQRQIWGKEWGGHGNPDRHGPGSQHDCQLGVLASWGWLHKHDPRG